MLEAEQEHLPVAQVEVGTALATVGRDVELLVVGGPTRAFGLSRPGTRRSAAQQAEDGLVSTGIGLREWLGTLSQGGASDVVVACFDTRVSKPRLPGSAAAAADKQLRRLGFRVLARSRASLSWEPLVPSYLGSVSALADGVRSLLRSSLRQGPSQQQVP